MKPYPEYKNSDVEWLGEIPKHWNNEKLKFSARIQFSNVDKLTVESEKPVRLCNYVDVYKNDYINDSLEFMAATATESEIQKFKILAGDVIITKDSEDPNDIAVPALVIQDLDNVLCGYHLAQIKSKKTVLHPPFLFRLFQAHQYNTHFRYSATGMTRYGVSVSAIKNAFTPIPNLTEQQAIANFLDFKTESINKFIANRQNQIDLLNEQKAAIINRAVTKGINSDATMKPSGIEWIGDIPNHWRICKLRRVLSVLTDFTANGSFADLAKNINYLYYPNYSRLIRLTDLRENLTNDGVYITKEAHEFLAKSELFGGEILMANVGAYAGLVCLMPSVDYKTSLGPNMLLMKFNGKLASTAYAFALLNSDSYLSLLSNRALSSAQPKLNKEDVKSIDLVLPSSLEEQQSILDFIDSETSKIDMLTTKYKSQIKLMQEYRAALISQAVTGKIDVREWKSN